MKLFDLAGTKGHLKVLCLGAHSDDIEIGAGGTLLELIAGRVPVEVHWCVFSAAGPRAAEAERSADAFLQGAAGKAIRLGQFKDGYLPYQGAEVKAWLEDVRKEVEPDVIFTHRHDDAHQDHREVCRLTWNTFRDNFILEYEIPKWDGDLGRVGAYMPLKLNSLTRKIDLLIEHFATQRSKDWFDPETFRGLARLRGMECRAAERYAEGFVVHKLCFEA